MQIHIVTEKKSQRWILRPWSEALARELPNASVGTNIDPSAEVNIFINYALYKPAQGITAAVFTHREHQGPLRAFFDNVAQQVDWCFAQCLITAALLPVGKTTILPLYPDPMFYKDPSLVLGVVGRPYKSGRKRMEWIEDLEQIQGVEVWVAGGKVSLEDMPTFYDSVDYLVILADNEGGPQPVLEALARGKPVIAPNVGYCWEYPVLRYTTKENLLALVRKLILPRNGWRQSALVIQKVFRGLLQ